MEEMWYWCDVGAVLVWYWCGVVMVLMFGYSKKSVRMFIIYTIEDLKWDKIK
jgi:hypothetical protein